MTAAEEMPFTFQARCLPDGQTPCFPFPKAEKYVIDSTAAPGISSIESSSCFFRHSHWTIKKYH